MPCRVGSSCPPGALGISDVAGVCRKLGDDLERSRIVGAGLTNEDLILPVGTVGGTGSPDDGQAPAAIIRRVDDLKTGRSDNGRLSQEGGLRIHPQQDPEDKSG